MKTITLLLATILVATIHSNAQQVFLFDLNHNTSAANVSSGNWNNHLGSTVNSSNDIVNFINDQGVASNYTFAVTDDFVAANDAGATSTNSDFPNTAMKDSYYVQDGSNTTGAFTLSGLNTSLYYHFEITGSRNGVSDVRESKYTATGLNSGMALLDVSNNQGNTVSILNIQPDAAGNIVLSLEKGAGNTNGSGFSYLGAFILTETSSPLSVSEFSLETSVKIFPNPVSDQFEVKLFLKEAANLKMELFDINGRLVQSLLNEEKSAGVVTFVWDRNSDNGNELSAGTYILEISANDQKTTSKLIIK